jgi:hypothetical protein
MERTSPTAAPTESAREGLQLEKAEFPEDALPTSCCACQREIVGTYFEVNARVACPGCRDQVAAAATGGSGARRFLRALAWGAGGALAGSALWMAITRWTGWEIGLVAILVGWMVGCGVRKGADGRGGWLYQGLAVGLSYLAIVATYVPDLHRSFLEEPGAEATPVQTASSEPAPATAGAEADALDVLALPLYGLFLLGVAGLLPFLSLPENLIGVLIIGFALFEAWKLNKRTPLVISGPFEAARPPRAVARGG